MAMSSLLAYEVLVGLVILERGAEQWVTRRNARWSFARGGKEFGRSHYPVMVLLHTLFLVGCTLEPPLLARPFVPLLGWPALAIVVGCQSVRWWCVATLGPQWSTRIIVVPGLPRVSSGLYRWLAHPNYVAVWVEGLAVPLVHTAWLTAVLFTAANTGLLRMRVREENRVLASAWGTE